jgi:hypothetical protein
MDEDWTAAELTEELGKAIEHEYKWVEVWHKDNASFIVHILDTDQKFVVTVKEATDAD